MATRRRRHRLRGHEGPVKTVAFAPGGRTLASGGVDETVRFWATDTGEPVRRLDPGQSWLEALAFAPDGRVLACGTPYESIRLWDLATGRPVARLGEVKHGTLCLAFSPDGRTLAAAGKSTTIRLIELATGQVRAKLHGHYDCVSSLAFAPDGRALASGSADRTVRVWDLTTSREVGRWQGHRDAVNAVALAPDGSALASASKDTTALVWDLRDSAPPRPARRELLPDEAAELWKALGREDAVEAYVAGWRLTASPEATIALVAARATPRPPGEDAGARRLVRKLDAEEFEQRQQASAALAELGARAEAALREALRGSPSPEARQRLEGLLRKLDTPAAREARRRWLRTLEVLERIGDRPARDVARRLAEGTVEAPSVTVEARATLDRMTTRRR
jgi:WD40 repeat protein